MGELWNEAVKKLKEASEKNNIQDSVKAKIAERKSQRKKSQRFLKPQWIELLRELENKIIFYYDSNGLWWMWQEDKFKWIICDEIDILIEILRYNPMLDLTNRNIKTEIINAMKLVGRMREVKKPKSKWIQFNDEVFNIETKETFKVSKKHFFTNPINWNIGESDSTPTMDKLITEWVGEKNLKLMYQIIAYSLYRDYPIHRIFCFTGSGRNGKSKYLGLITKFLGEENSTTSDLDLLMTRPFESFKLYKKLICQMGETNYEGLKRTAILKQLSGQDMISFEKKGKDGFTDYNYAKLMISTNGIPITHDKSDGFYRRWLIIDFPNEFSEGKDILKSIPDVEFDNLARKCVNLLPELLEEGRFYNEPTIEEKKRIYEEKSNPLGKFLREKTIKDINGYIPNFEFIDNFKVWLNENGYRLMNDSDIRAMMKEHYEYDRKMTKYSNNAIWSWIGIRWLLEDDLSEMSEMSTNSSQNTYIESDLKPLTNLTILTNKILVSSIKLIFNMSFQITEQELLEKLNEICDFEYVDFIKIIDKMIEDGDIMLLNKSKLLYCRRE